MPTPDTVDSKLFTNLRTELQEVVLTGNNTRDFLGKLDTHYADFQKILIQGQGNLPNSEPEYEAELNKVAPDPKEKENLNAAVQNLAGRLKCPRLKCLHMLLEVKKDTPQVGKDSITVCLYRFHSEQANQLLLLQDIFISQRDDDSPRALKNYCKDYVSRLINDGLIVRLVEKLLPLAQDMEQKKESLEDLGLLFDEAKALALCLYHAVLTCSHAATRYAQENEVNIGYNNNIPSVNNDFKLAEKVNVQILNGILEFFKAQKTSMTGSVFEVVSILLYSFIEGLICLSSCQTDKDALVGTIRKLSFPPVDTNNKNNKKQNRHHHRQHGQNPSTNPNYMDMKFVDNLNNNWSSEGLFDTCKVAAELFAKDPNDMSTISSDTSVLKTSLETHEGFLQFLHKKILLCSAFVSFEDSTFKYLESELFLSTLLYLLQNYYDAFKMVIKPREEDAGRQGEGPQLFHLFIKILALVFKNWPEKAAEILPGGAEIRALENNSFELFELLRLDISSYPVFKAYVELLTSLANSSENADKVYELLGNGSNIHPMLSWSRFTDVIGYYRNTTSGNVDKIYNNQTVRNHVVQILPDEVKGLSSMLKLLRKVMLLNDGCRNDFTRLYNPLFDLLCAGRMERDGYGRMEYTTAFPSHLRAEIFNTLSAMSLDAPSTLRSLKDRFYPNIPKELMNFKGPYDELLGFLRFIKQLFVLGDPKDESASFHLGFVFNCFEAVSKETHDKIDPNYKKRCQQWSVLHLCLEIFLINLQNYDMQPSDFGTAFPSALSPLALAPMSDTLYNQTTNNNDFYLQDTSTTQFPSPPRVTNGPFDNYHSNNTNTTMNDTYYHNDYTYNNGSTMNNSNIFNNNSGGNNNIYNNSNGYVNSYNGVMHHDLDYNNNNHHHGPFGGVGGGVDNGMALMAMNQHRAGGDAAKNENDETRKNNFLLKKALKDFSAKRPGYYVLHKLLSAGKSQVLIQILAILDYADIESLNELFSNGDFKSFTVSNWIAELHQTMESCALHVLRILKLAIDLQTPFREQYDLLCASGTPLTDIVEHLRPPRNKSNMSTCKNRNYLGTIALYVAYDRNAEICALAVSLLYSFSCCLSLENRLVFLLIAEPQDRHTIIQAFNKRLRINTAVHADSYVSNNKERLMSEIPEAILNLILYNLKEIAYPNVAHLLLGFDLLCPKDTNFGYSSGNSFSLSKKKHSQEVSDWSCFHFILNTMMQDLLSDSQSKDANKLFKSNPHLSEMCFELIYRLCSTPCTSSLVMNYLRREERSKDFFTLNLSHMLISPPTSLLQHPINRVNQAQTDGEHADSESCVCMSENCRGEIRSESPKMVVKGLSFHCDCCHCYECKVPFLQSTISGSQGCYIIGESRLYCDKCYIDETNVSFLHQQAWFLKSIALEIHVSIQERPFSREAQKLIKMLFTRRADKSNVNQEDEDEDENDLELENNGEYMQQRRRKMLELLDALQKEPDKDDLSQILDEKRNLDVNLSDFEIKSSRGVIIYDVAALEQELRSKPHFQDKNTGVPRLVYDGYEDKEASSGSDAIFGILKIALKVNNKQELMHARRRMFSAWREVLEVSLKSFNLLKAAECEQILYELTQDVLDKLRGNVDDKIGPQLSRVVLVLMNKLREMSETFDPRTHACSVNLPVDQLFGLLRDIIEAAVQNNCSQTMRYHLYGSFLVYIKMTRGSKDCTPEQQRELDLGNKNIIETYQSNLQEIVARDAIRGNDVTKALSFAVLDVLIGYDSQNSVNSSPRLRQHDGVLKFLNHRGYIGQFVDSFARENQALCSILEVNPAYLNIMGIFKAKMAFLIRMASQVDGAYSLLHSSVITRFSECNFIRDIPSHLEASPAVVDRYHQIHLHVLRLINAIQSTLGIQNTDVAEAVANFLSVKNDLVLSILKQSISQHWPVVLEKLVLLTGILYHTSPHEQLLHNNLGSTASRLRTLQLSMFAKICVKEAWSSQYNNSFSKGSKYGGFFDAHQQDMLIDESVPKEDNESSFLYSIIANVLSYSRAVLQASQERGKMVPIFTPNLAHAINMPKHSMQDSAVTGPTPSLGVVVICARLCVRSLRCRIMHDSTYIEPAPFAACPTMMILYMLENALYVIMMHLRFFFKEATVSHSIYSRDWKNTTSAAELLTITANERSVLLSEGRTSIKPLFEELNFLDKKYTLDVDNKDATGEKENNPNNENNSKNNSKGKDKDKKDTSIGDGNNKNNMMILERYDPDKFALHNVRNEEYVNRFSLENLNDEEETSNNNNNNSSSNNNNRGSSSNNNNSNNNSNNNKNRFNIDTNNDDNYKYFEQFDLNKKKTNKKEEEAIAARNATHGGKLEDFQGKRVDFLISLIKRIEALLE